MALLFQHWGRLWARRERMFDADLNRNGSSRLPSKQMFILTAGYVAIAYDSTQFIGLDCPVITR